MEVHWGPAPAPLMVGGEETLEEAAWRLPLAPLERPPAEMTPEDTGKGIWYSGAGRAEGWDLLGLAPKPYCHVHMARVGEDVRRGLARV